MSAGKMICLIWLMSQSVVHNMYFIAILCPEQIDNKIFQLKQWMKERFGCVVGLKSQAHITLIPPFWLDVEQESLLMQVLDNFKSDLDELEIQLDGFSHFGKKVLFIRVNENPGLDEIKKQTEEYFRTIFPRAIKKDDRPFWPHVTVATRDLKPSDFLQALEYFSCKQFAEIFCTKTISLLKLVSGKWSTKAQKQW